MSYTIAILATGSELLDGRTADTNSQYICARTCALGLEITHILICGDNQSEIVQALKFLAPRVDAIIVSGGLGPTSDDLTREAIAELLGVKLELSQPTLDRLKILYTERKRPFDPANTKQALFPFGAEIIPNALGTAAGFSVWYTQAQHKTLIQSFPGVPRELKPMLEESGFPSLLKVSGVEKPRYLRTLRIFGLAEATIGARIDTLPVSAEIKVSYRAAFPEIQVGISATQDPQVVDAFTTAVSLVLGSEHIFSDNLETNLEGVVFELLKSKGQTLSVAESCTGGMLGALLTNPSGASGSFIGGAITYSNQTKTDLLNVAPALIKHHGAVSHAVACAMAEGARRVFKTDLAVSITGIAGPSGGSAEKPVGTFYLGFADAKKVESFHCYFKSSRSMIRTFAAWTALDLVRRHLLGLSKVHDLVLVKDSK